MRGGCISGAGAAAGSAAGAAGATAAGSATVAGAPGVVAGEAAGAAAGVGPGAVFAGFSSTKQPVAPVAAVNSTRDPNRNTVFILATSSGHGELNAPPCGAYRGSRVVSRLPRRRGGSHPPLPETWSSGGTYRQIVGPSPLRLAIVAHEPQPKPSERTSARSARVFGSGTTVAHRRCLVVRGLRPRLRREGSPAGRRSDPLRGEAGERRRECCP